MPTKHTVSHTALFPDGFHRKVEAVYGIQQFPDQPPYFTLTGSVWVIDPDTSRAGREPDTSGQVTEDILFAFPWLDQMRTVHLANAENGLPMHAAANAWFWFNAKNEARPNYPIHYPKAWESMTRAMRAAAYLGVGPEHFAGVKTSKDIEQVVESLKPLFQRRAELVRETYGLEL